MTWEHLGPIFGRPEAILELSYTGKRVNLIMLILHLFYELFCGLEAISGQCWGGSRVTWDHLGLILGHPVAIFEAMLHRKACELENVDFTLVLYAFLVAWKLSRGYV